MEYRQQEGKPSSPHYHHHQPPEDTDTHRHACRLWAPSRDDLLSAAGVDSSHLFVLDFRFRPGPDRGDPLPRAAQHRAADLRVSPGTLRVRPVVPQPGGRRPAGVPGGSEQRRALVQQPERKPLQGRLEEQQAVDAAHPGGDAGGHGPLLLPAEEQEDGGPVEAGGPAAARRDPSDAQTQTQTQGGGVRVPGQESETAVSGLWLLRTVAHGGHSGRLGRGSSLHAVLLQSITQKMPSPLCEERTDEKNLNQSTQIRTHVFYPMYRSPAPRGS